MPARQIIFIFQIQIIQLMVIVIRKKYLEIRNINHIRHKANNQRTIFIHYIQKEQLMVIVVRIILLIYVLIVTTRLKIILFNQQMQKKYLELKKLNHIKHKAKHQRTIHRKNTNQKMRNLNHIGDTANDQRTFQRKNTSQQIPIKKKTIQYIKKILKEKETHVKEF